MTETSKTIAKHDWLKVNFAAFSPEIATAHAAMLEAMKARKAAVAALPETKAAELAADAFERELARVLIERGVVVGKDENGNPIVSKLPEGKRPLVSRFGDLAMPSKHFKDSEKKSTSKRQAVELAPLYSADKKRK